MIQLYIFITQKLYSGCREEGSYCDVKGVRCSGVISSTLQLKTGGVLSSYSPEGGVLTSSIEFKKFILQIIIMFIINGIVVKVRSVRFNSCVLQTANSDVTPATQLSR